MPRENTHLLFGDRVLDNIEDQKLKSIIDKNKKYYYFGTILPDSFYYSKEKKVVSVSDYIHSKDGNLTNEIIFKWLDLIKKNNRELEFSALCGVLTHYAIDSIFHPAIYYLSGNYYDQDPEKRKSAVYLHRHLETSLDRKINAEYDTSKITALKNLDLSALSFLGALAGDFKLELNSFKQAIKRQIFYCRLFKSRFLFEFFYFLYQLGLIKAKEDLSLFYGNLNKDSVAISDPIVYQDLVSGKAEEAKINALMKDSEKLALSMINSAFAYYLGEISKEQCSQAIDGRSLNVNKIGVSTNDIKFTKFS